MARRFLFVVYGSAGDLFPVIPIMSRLRAEGHEVLCALPRPLSMLLRPLGIPVHGLGRGAEMAVADSADALTPRFGGWASVRSLVLRYGHTTLETDVDALDELIDAWQPAAVVATTLAASARVAARRHSCQVVHLSVHPQVLARAKGATGYARAYRTKCAELAGHPHATDLVGDELAWGIAQETLVLHDPVLSSLVDDQEVSRIMAPDARHEFIGFPYWDRAVHSNASLEEVRGWIAASSAPVVLVTLGSFLGASRSAQWRAVQQSLTALGLRTLLLVSRRDIRSLQDATPNMKVVAGYLPLSQLLGGVSCAVHHGGLGTTFAALRAAVPSVVTPMAFDQPFNARLLETCGVGHIAAPGDVGTMATKVLGDSAFAERAQHVASLLTATETATDNAVRHITAGMSGP